MKPLHFLFLMSLYSCVGVTYSITFASEIAVDGQETDLEYVVRTGIETVEKNSPAHVIILSDNLPESTKEAVIKTGRTVTEPEVWNLPAPGELLIWGIHITSEDAIFRATKGGQRNPNSCVRKTKVVYGRSKNGRLFIKGGNTIVC